MMSYGNNSEPSKPSKNSNGKLSQAQTKARYQHRYTAMNGPQGPSSYVRDNTGIAEVRADAG